MTSQTHNDRLTQMKDQFARERSAIRKQLQLQISEVLFNLLADDSKFDQ